MISLDLLMKQLDNSAASCLLEKIFIWLDSAGIKYCVERNYHGYPQKITGDVDLILLDNQLPDAAQGVMDIGLENGWSCYQAHIWEKSAYLGFIKGIYPQRFALTIELFAGARWHGFPYLSANQVVDERLKCGVTWSPRPAHQAIITSIHHLLYNGHIPVKYRQEICELCNKEKALFHVTLAEAFSDRLAKDISNSILSQAWEELKPRKLRLNLIRKALFKDPFEMARVLKQGVVAKRGIPDGVALVVHSGDPSSRRLLCENLLVVADNWHLFVPPFRHIFPDPKNTTTKQINQSAIQILNNGGVVIVNCVKEGSYLSALAFPYYDVTLEENYGLISFSESSPGQNIVKKSIAEDKIELLALPLWEYVMLDKAKRNVKG